MENLLECHRQSAGRKQLANDLPKNADMDLTDYEMVVLALGLIGVYLKLHQEVTVLKSRVYTLESTNTKIEGMLSQLSADIAEIKLLLARNQMDK